MNDKTHIETSSETIEGTVKRILFRGDDDRFAVGLLALDAQTELLRIAGELGGISDGDRVRLIGRFRQDARFG